MTDKEPAIRPAVASDADSMKTCVGAAYSRYIERIGKPPAPMLDDYADIVTKHQAYVAEEDGRIVGVLVVMEWGSGILMDNVAVPPDCQGRGIGGRLIDLAETLARDQGYPRIDTYTNEIMTENIAIYKRRGYVEEEHRIVKGYRRVYMFKPLA